jgi:predicted transcriptional regulator
LNSERSSFNVSLHADERKPTMPNDSTTTRNHDELLRMVTDIVASYVSHAKVASSELPELIDSVYQSLNRPISAPPVPLEPAVAVRKSITPDYLICLEDGAKLKMLKRYLMTSYGLTPEAYREKWGLPRDYPMVAPNYAKRRSALAKESGLGRRPAGTEVKGRAAVEQATPRRRGRPRG